MVAPVYTAYTAFTVYTANTAYKVPYMPTYILHSYMVKQSKITSNA